MTSRFMSGSDSIRPTCMGHSPTLKQKPPGSGRQSSACCSVSSRCVRRAGAAKLPLQSSRWRPSRRWTPPKLTRLRRSDMYRLFREFAHRYDLHTPPGHYKHDHAFVISEALRVAPEKCRLLDVGCGTGVFLETALAAGLDAHGLDVAPEMIEVAARRVGADRVRIKPMQEIDEDGAYDIVCSLSWTIHYAESLADLEDVIARCRRALRPGGLLILQVANEDAMTGAVSVDVEPGRSGEPDDTYFIHRFTPLRHLEHRVSAHY